MTDLEVLDDRRLDGRCELIARIADEPACADGHFPEFPVVPGFVQVGWAIDMARALTGGGALRRIEALKFKHVLRPGETIVLAVERSPGGVRFALERAGVTVSSGRLVFDGTESARP
jgi:3-hydroxymyristoyl/3-hydroxydecanoyl-(acyl carrier protein) dehydratase